MTYKQWTVSGAVGMLSGAALACDVCATHLALAAHDAPGKTTVSVFEQYSDYDRPAGGGHALTAYNTQFAALHWFSERLALQAGLPVLDKELDGGEATESGIGDATALALWRAFKREQDADYATLDVVAGLKAPTGDTEPLKEERDVALEAQAHAAHGHEGGHAPHAHGHHVALGSGSWDGILGINGLCKQGRVLAVADVQYLLRTEGDYEFQYGDALTARAGLYGFAWLAPEGSLALGAEIVSDNKDEDQVLDESQDGSDGEAVYAGPALRATWRDRLTAFAAVDLPVSGEDDGLEGAADLRVRGALAATF